MDNFLGATQESLELTKQAMKNTELAKAITLATGIQGYNLEAPKFVGR